MISTIQIQIENIGFKELERCRQILHCLFEQGALNVRNGKVTLNFDSDGTLRQLDFNVTKWRSDKERLKTLQIYEEVKIAIAN